MKQYGGEEGSKNVSSQICREPSLSCLGRGEGVSKSKAAQNVLKHILILEFVKI